MRFVTETGSWGAGVGALHRRFKAPDLRGPMVALLAAAMTVAVSVVIPVGGTDRVAGDAETGAASAATAAVAASQAASQFVQPGEVPDGLNAAEWRSIQEQIAAARAVDAVPATVSRPSAAPIDSSAAPLVTGPRIASAGTVAAFTAAGAAVTAGKSADGALGVVLRAGSIGEVLLASTAPVMVNGRAYFLHTPIITEWYRDTADGLQQLFTIAEPVTTDPTTVIEVEVAAGTPTLIDSQTVEIAANDGTRFTYRDLIAWDATGASLPAEMDVVDGAITLNVDTADATYPITIDPTITEDQKLLAHGSAGDEFGTSVATDANAGPGAIVVVGAPGDDTLGNDVGAVFVYRSNGSTFEEETILYPPPTGASRFGRDVAVLGDRIVVGAPGDDANGVDAGVVYVYERFVSGWSLTSTIYSCDVGVGACGDVAAGGFDGDEFGRSVAIGNDGGNDVILVGAPGGSVGGTPGGAAYVFEPVAADWQTNSAQAIANPNAAVGDAFGTAVDISTNGFNIVVGAPNADDAGFSDAGMAWWFTYDGSNVGAASRLVYGSFRGNSNNLGWAVTVDVHSSGDIVAFVGFPILTGEPGDGGAATANGFVSYSIPAGTPSGSPRDFFQSNSGGNGFVDALGRSLDFDGTTLVQGWAEYDAPAVNGGWVRISTYSSPATLTFVGGVDLPEAAGDQWGDAVAVSGDVVVAAGRLVDLPSGIGVQVDAGRVGVAQVSSLATPAQLLNESTALDLFGWAVDIDGDRMAVSARDSDLAGLLDAGAVYMFVRDDATSAWVADGVILSPTPEEGGQFGDAVALLGDRVAIGESDSFGDQADYGRVFVFERTAPATWTQLGSEISSQTVSWDAFGASIAWQDLNTLVIGAPAEDASTGAVYQTFFDGSSWSPPGNLASPGAGVGDQLGFSVAVDQDRFGNWIIAAGAPGDDGATGPGPDPTPDPTQDSGALYIYTSDGGGAVYVQTVQTGGTGWLAGDRMGTGVASDNGYLAVAGVGDGTAGSRFQAFALEDTGSGYFIFGSFTGSALPVTVENIPNSYVALQGRNLFLGRPGSGGQVGIFRDIDGNGFPATPTDLFDPPGLVNGDAFGFSVAVDGRSIAAGAPGDESDAGATYTNRALALSHTFVGPGIAFGNPNNWDTGLVPNANDVAIVPAGGVEVGISGAQQVGALLVGAGSTVTVEEGVGNSFAITGGAAGDEVSTINGTLRFEADGTIDGRVNNAGTVVLGGGSAVVVDGTGVLDNVGTIVGESFGGGATLASSVTLSMESVSIISVATGSLTIGSDFTNTGSININEDAILTTTGAVALAGTSSVTFAISGSSASGDYGRWVVDGSLSLGGTIDIFQVGYSPTAADSYTVIAGCNCPGQSFATDNTAPLVATVGATDVTLALPASAPTTVNSTGDLPDLNPGDGVCETATFGECTLRAAIEETNAFLGDDTIEFDIDGSGVHTIAPTSALPVIADTVTIDGYSQPGASANTLAVGSDAVILIELDGSSAGGAPGLDFRNAGSDGSVVQGLAINRVNGYAIAAGPGTQVRGNHIGTDAAGTTALANTRGVLVDTAATQPVTVGGTTPAERNVISGNALIGVQVLAVGGTTAGTTIVGNYIGTDSTGTTALPNGSEGIWVGADPGALVTGTAIGDGTIGGRNVISGNTGEGIAMWDNSTLTVIRGNYVGVGADGSTPLGNALVGGCAVFHCGAVVIRNNISNNTVGGNLPGDGNVIAHNSIGVIAFSGVNNRFVGNSFFDNIGEGLLVNPVAVPSGSFNFFVPANDPGDFDGGANRGQNFPVLTPTIDGTNFVVGSSIDSDRGGQPLPDPDRRLRGGQRRQRRGQDIPRAHHHRRPRFDLGRPRPRRDARRRAR